LLPLYPQFSTTTAGSSLAAWHDEAKRQGLADPTRAVSAYPTEPGFVAALAGLIGKGLTEAAGQEKPFRLLFSAHGFTLQLAAHDTRCGSGSAAPTAGWRSRAGCRSILECRRSAPSQNSSRGWRVWCAMRRQQRPSKNRHPRRHRCREQHAGGGLSLAEGAAY